MNFFANIFYLPLPVALLDNFLLPDISDAPDILLFDSYSGGTEIYVGVALLLIIIDITLFFIKYAKDRQTQQQVAQLRGDVFTKITNEFRTPLTIILGLSKQLRHQKELTNNSLAYLNAIERQGKYLGEMTGRLLDIANLQMPDKAMEWKTGNIVAFMEMVSETFRIYAKQKDIELSFFSDETVVEVDFVPDYLKKILYNLLSNAIKYSDEGDRVYLILERDKKTRRKILIKVIDYGKGISPELLPYIFEFFCKGPYAEAKTADKGIGLAIAKRLTEIMNGTIEVETEKGKGTTFTLRLPVRKNKNQIFSYWQPEKKIRYPIIKPEEKAEYKELFSSEIKENDLRTTIFLVESNRDIALYIRSMFHQEQYNIIYAADGGKAWEMMNRQPLPDIVIADAIMPKKSGIELCREMKTSALHNHIPIIIISAKNRRAGLIESLKSGADSYIKKPFNPEELQVCVENLLRNRQLLKEKYHRTVLKDEKSISGSNQNSSDFLRHVTDIIFREMKNSDFSSVKLAQELALSVSQLNKKLSAATGYPSSVYILQVRLEHAKKILSTQNKTISEVAAECGIYDVNYFSRAFKKHNGITPTQFKRLPFSLQS